MEPRILLVDGDPWMQRVARSALADRGYRIELASDGCEAFARAVAHPPDLVLSEVLMPRMNGFRLIRKLRAHRSLAATPFLFLTRLHSPEVQRHGFRLGADDLLCKPVHPRDLTVRVAGALGRSRLPQAARRSRTGAVDNRGLSGALEDISLASLLVLLEMERKTGILVLTNCTTGERCRAFLCDGRILGALLDKVAPLRHVELLLHVLGWSRGSFSFQALPVEMPDEVRTSTTHLLLEAGRRLDESRRALDDDDDDDPAADALELPLLH